MTKLRGYIPTMLLLVTLMFGATAANAGILVNGRSAATTTTTTTTTTSETTTTEDTSLVGILVNGVASAVTFVRTGILVNG